MLGRIAPVLILLGGCDQVFALERDEVVLSCPASFRELDGAYYQRLDEMMTWHEAETACEALRDPALTGFTHLAVLDSNEEMAAILADLTVDLFWIGHTDIAAEGVFVPVTLQDVGGWPPLTTPPWAGEQPNNLNDNQHCLIVDNQDLLDDKKCVSTTEKFRAVCECDLFESNAPLPPPP